MEKFVIERDDMRPLRFEGELIAKADNSFGPNGHRDRWYELRLYRTVAGMFVAERVGCSQWQDERTLHEAAHTGLESGVVEFFGMSNLAKEIYEQAGIDFAEDV